MHRYEWFEKLSCEREFISYHKQIIFGMMLFSPTLTTYFPYLSRMSYGIMLQPTTTIEIPP
jgi:hypothetical protein